HIADFGNIVNQDINTLLRNLDAGERVHDVTSLDHLWRRNDRSWDAFEQANPYIHLEEFEAALHAFLEQIAHLRTIRHGGGIDIATHAVTELPPRQHIAGNAIGLARQIHQRHFDATNATGLTTMMAELLNLAEDLIDIAGVFTDQTALEQQGIGLAGAV